MQRLRLIAWVCAWPFFIAVKSLDTQGPIESIVLLESYPSYSVLLPISHQTKKNETFIVQSPRFHRIMAVIQFINLPPKKDFTCGSYLQFQDGADTKSDRICGNFDPEERSYAPSSLIGPRTYTSFRDQLKVSLIKHPGSGKLQNYYARIAFTAFRDDCYYFPPKNFHGAGSHYPRYRPCVFSTAPNGSSRNCIVASLFCDTVLHCAPLDSTGKDFAEDESPMNCPPSQSYYTEPSSHQRDGENEESGGREGKVKSFLNEREEYFADIFKKATIAFVGICTLCVLVAFVLSIFCMGRRRCRDVKA